MAGNLTIEFSSLLQLSCLVVATAEDSSSLEKFPDVEVSGLLKSSLSDFSLYLLKTGVL